MKKIDVGQTFGILANIGVIGGIVFLGVEISQNTCAQESSSYQALMAGIANLDELELSDPGLPLLLLGSGEVALADMEPNDRQRAQSYMFILLRYGDMALHQFELDLISEARLASALAPLQYYSCSSVFQELLDRMIAEC